MRLLLVLAVAVATVSAASLESILKPGFPEGRIINGQPAAKGQAPFIVSLKRGDHFCGGSLIDPHWVLTAAHCLTFDSFQVVAGLHKRDDESDVQIRTVPNKSVQFSHEKYDGGVGPYDIGLIYFAIPFDLMALADNGFAAVATINLPSGQYKETGPGKLFGWGIDNSGSKPNTLQTLDVDIIDYNECNVVMASIFPVDPVNICSYTAGTTDGACSSDSGGPLVRYTADGPEIVGVVSWGLTPCDAHSYPSVYTKVSAFKDWIQTTIDGLGNSTSFW